MAAALQKATAERRIAMPIAFFIAFTRGCTGQRRGTQAAFTVTARKPR
jgi:hypothetical protein